MNPRQSGQRSGCMSHKLSLIQSFRMTVFMAVCMMLHLSSIIAAMAQTVILENNPLDPKLQ